jgi:integrase
LLQKISIAEKRQCIIIRKHLPITNSLQWYEGKQRRTLSLSGRKYRKKTAEHVKAVIETLIYYRDNGIVVPEASLKRKLESASVEIQEKLAKVGLIAVTKLKICQELWDTFLKHKTDVKPTTTQGYQNCRTHFFEAFKPSETVDKITSDRLVEWKKAMRTQLTEASVATYLKNVRTVLNWAVKQEWLTKNPMSGIPIGSFRNHDNDQIISMAEYVKLLDACPNQEWRTIIALVRIGGLRCPSELKRLRWSDINWAENRFFVRSSKTEHHEGKHARIVPLFPELRAVLDQHFFSLDETEKNEFVITQYQRSSWSLGDPFKTIAERAGLTIVRPFDNMRMTRSNEVESRWGSRLESLWIGHSEQVQKKFYAMATAEDFAKATGADMDGQIPHAKSHAILTCQE